MSRRPLRRLLLLVGLVVATTGACQPAPGQDCIVLGDWPICLPGR